MEVPPSVAPQSEEESYPLEYAIEFRHGAVLNSRPDWETEYASEIWGGILQFHPLGSVPNVTVGTLTALRCSVAAARAAGESLESILEYFGQFEFPPLFEPHGYRYRPEVIEVCRTKCPLPDLLILDEMELQAEHRRKNLGLARQQMKEAVQINGSPIPPLTLLLPGTDTRYRQSAEYMVSQMANIGLTIRPEHHTWARFQEIIDARQAQLYMLGWQADYPDEQTFLQLFYSKNAGERGVNATGYSNPEFDQLYERAAPLAPGAERDELYRNMQRLVMRDCPWLITHYPITYTLYYDWVKQFNMNNYAHGLRAYQCLDGEARANWSRRN